MIIRKKTPLRKAQRLLPSVDVSRERAIRPVTKMVAENPNAPLTPVPCSGASFQCSVAGSGKTPVRDIPTTPMGYDFLGTPIQEGGMMGKKYQPNFILNWQNNSVETEYTKHSLKATYGFENFQ